MNRETMRVLTSILLCACLRLAGSAAADEAPVFREADTKLLAEGQCVVLDCRPDESGKGDPRFVTVACLITGSRETIWEVINDKDNAASFLEGVLESKVIERDGNQLLVEQRTKVGGPKGSYQYRLRHELTPMTRATFTYAGGELEDVIGAWWIFDGPDPDCCLVVYSLYIDAGFFAPHAIVKAGMKRTIPKTMASIAAEVARRGNPDKAPRP